jgi:hypothetical protein
MSRLMSPACVRQCRSANHVWQANLTPSANYGRSLSSQSDPSAHAVQPHPPAGSTTACWIATPRFGPSSGYGYGCKVGKWQTDRKHADSVYSRLVYGLPFDVANLTRRPQSSCNLRSAIQTLALPRAFRDPGEIGSARRLQTQPLLACCRDCCS